MHGTGQSIPWRNMPKSLRTLVLNRLTKWPKEPSNIIYATNTFKVKYEDLESQTDVQYWNCDYNRGWTYVYHPSLVCSAFTHHSLSNSGNFRPSPHLREQSEQILHPRHTWNRHWISSLVESRGKMQREWNRTFIAISNWIKRSSKELICPDNLQRKGTIRNDKEWRHRGSPLVPVVEKLVQCSWHVWDACWTTDMLLDGHQVLPARRLQSMDVSTSWVRCERTPDGTVRRDSYECRSPTSDVSLVITWSI